MSAPSSSISVRHPHLTSFYPGLSLDYFIYLTKKRRPSSPNSQQQASLYHALHYAELTVAMNSTTLDNEPFKNAIAKFQASLAPNEQSLFSKCASADELHDTVRNFGIIKKISDSNRVLKRVRDFNRSLGHYFAVIGILVQSHPEFAALAWGAARLALQLASNFHEFFDKLTKTLERLADALPWYEDLALTLKRDKHYRVSSRLISSLTKIYVDILTFFQSVVRVFTKRDTSQRSKPMILTSLFWKPFDARFQDVLDDMTYHKKLLKAEFSLYQHKTTHEFLTRECVDLKTKLQGLKESSSIQADYLKEIESRLSTKEDNMETVMKSINVVEKQLREPDKNALAQMEDLTEEIGQKLQSEHRERLHHLIRQWLSAPEFAKELEEAQKRRAPGTSRWIFEQKTFLRWLEYTHGPDSQAQSRSFGNHAIWIQGHPGFGKTVIAGALVDHLRNVKHSDSPLLYFFFRHGPTSGHVIAAYRSLLMQLLHFYSQGTEFELFDKFAFAMQFSSTGQGTGTRAELFELLRISLSATGPHFIVLDGIDECSDTNSLVWDLLKLGPNSRVVLLSRPNVRILHDKVPYEQRVVIGKLNSNDIRIFIKGRLDDLAEREMLINDAEIHMYTDHLANGADGMFLWARLMTDYLESEALSDQDRHDTITAVTMPEGLDLMYLRIINLICQGYTANKNLARWVILWITFGKRPLSVGELEDSTRLLRNNPKALIGRIDFDKAVIMACAGLVERAIVADSYGQVSCFRFIHITAKEYFCRLSNVSRFQSNPQVAIYDAEFLSIRTPHIEIAGACLQYALNCVPARSLGEALGGQMGAKVTVPDLGRRFRFLYYAAKLWIPHLLEACGEIFGHNKLHPDSLEKRTVLLRTLTQFLHQNQNVRTWVETIYIFAMPVETFSNFLGIISNKLSQRPALVGEYGLDVEDVARLVGELKDYLLLLDKYYGSRLKKCPGDIWVLDEIDGFVPSRFSDRPTTTVHTLKGFHSSQAGNNLSSQYLCKVSKSISGFIGVLSIWTSKAYEEHQKQQIPSALLKDECVCGWIARYEIWSIGESPKRLLFHEIRLQDNEVRLQLLQSLKTYSINAPDWNIQFPLTIDPNLYQFGILRTVYRLSRKEGKPEGQVKSFTLDLNLDSEAERNWNPLSIYCSELNRVGTHVPVYNYWIRFGADGSRLFFIDHHGFQFLEIIDVVFHPTKPIVAYQTGSMVFLWTYQNSQNRPFLFYATPRKLDSYPENISFSRTSDHFVIKEHKSESAVVLKLPRRILCALDDESETRSRAEQNNDENSPISYPKLDLWSFQSESRSLINGLYAETFSSGESQGINISSSTGDIDMVFWRNTVSDHEKQKIDVIRLPRWGGMENLEPSVGLPKPGESEITVVLDRPAQFENYFRPPAQEHEPVVIRKNVESLRLLENDGFSSWKRLGDGGAMKRKREISDEEKRPDAHPTARSALQSNSLN
ncbi:hypothetical protein BS50DRAFT_681838 [Corynespora cassiicola Philippines]|uniref:Uncharacterized protein n=1 Tax=Corynespora cassiicola Philippines TaxID=1448308 RepID=A0A2T2N3G1_CORCC|nr:hypothetical protein BS50DRAFT_681838 [Corynespora cassiicola Philippines]